MNRVDPTTTASWQAIHREASLVSQLIGAGATALSRANYGSGFGEYYAAFFGLSIGMERLAKLILIADFVIANAGVLPDQNVVRKYGHKLKSLITAVGSVAEMKSIEVPHIGPDDPICAAVIDCLHAFAEASQGRYANFEAIGNPQFNIQDEPVHKWWNQVVEPILDKHYRGRKAEAGVKARAQLLNALAGHVMFVRHTDESGQPMSDVETASERTGQTRWAQRYGRFYTLAVVRWLAYIFSELTMARGYEPALGSLFGHYEFFSTYMVDDSFLRTRKIWPL